MHGPHLGGLEKILEKGLKTKRPTLFIGPLCANVELLYDILKLRRVGKGNCVELASRDNSVSSPSDTLYQRSWHFRSGVNATI